jgi:replicative DNA helicase
MNTITKETMQQIMKIAIGEKTTDIVPTGFTELDKLLHGGFHKSNLIILAARPSMGKTAFAIAVAMNVANPYKTNTPVGFFSVEMPTDDIAKRMLSTLMGTNSNKIIAAGNKKEIDKSLITAVGELAKYPIFVDDSHSLSINELRAKCRRLKKEQNVGLIIVDYIQYLRPVKAETREREVAIISHSLKGIARDINVPVIALSQLSRAYEARVHDGKDVRPEKTPKLSDLRESGSIEQDADVVMFIHRPEALLFSDPNKDNIIKEND